jgi:hypothetical protein
MIAKRPGYFRGALMFQAMILPRFLRAGFLGNSRKRTNLLDDFPSPSHNAAPEGI